MPCFTFCILGFIQNFCIDIGVVDFDEPFHKLFNQGMITGKNGIKMSKSKGNVVSPDALVNDYGCDSLRMYELFCRTAGVGCGMGRQRNRRSKPFPETSLESAYGQ